jgi:hypothetical protein
MRNDQPVRAAVVYPDLTIRQVVLVGDDSARFARVKRLIGDCSVSAIAISDQDGPAAVGWVDDDGANKGLRPNKLASALADRLVLGPMVVTGLGRGDDESMTSVHEGLRHVLGQMAREACQDTEVDRQDDDELSDAKPATRCPSDLG